MDLSAVANSTALAALQTLASAGAPTNASAAGAPEAPKAQSASDQAVVTGAGASASLYAVSQATGHALSAADAAASAGQTVLGLLAQMGQAAGQMAGGGVDASAVQALGTRFQANAAAIGPALQAATVGGVNLVDGSLVGGLKIGLGDGAQTSFSSLDLTLAGPTLGLGGANLDTPDAAAAAQASVETASGATKTALDGLQAQADSLGAHIGFMQSLGQAISGLPASDGGDGARLLALQVSQQLSTQPSAAIANAGPQQVLALFRS